MDWYNSPKYVPTTVEKLTEAKATYALRSAWWRIYKEEPSERSLALLWAQSALETGRWKIIRNNNFGNIKKKHANLKYGIKDDGHLFTMFATGENLYDKNSGKVKYFWFEPPHTQTHFRAYDSITDGAEDYIRFISKRKRYKKAWEQVIKGDPVKFSKELSRAGYYTADEKIYTAGVVRLFNEFLRRKDELLAYEPEKEPDMPENIPYIWENPDVDKSNQKQDKLPTIERRGLPYIFLILAATVGSLWAYISQFWN